MSPNHWYNFYINNHTYQKCSLLYLVEIIEELTSAGEAVDSIVIFDVTSHDVVYSSAFDDEFGG